MYTGDGQISDRGMTYVDDTEIDDRELIGNANITYSFISACDYNIYVILFMLIYCMYAYIIYVWEYMIYVMQMYVHHICVYESLICGIYISRYVSVNVSYICGMC